MQCQSTASQTNAIMVKINKGLEDSSLLDNLISKQLSSYSRIAMLRKEIEILNTMLKNMQQVILVNSIQS